MILLKSIIFSFVFLFSVYGEDKITPDLGPTLSASVDSAQISTGDTLKFTIRLVTDAAMDLTIPDIGGKIEGFRVVDFNLKDPKILDGFKISERIYSLRADISGSYILPSISLVYKKNNSDVTLETSEIFVEVKSNLKEGDLEKGELRDIKDIINSSNNNILIYSFVSILIILFLGMLYFYLKKKKRLLPIEVVAPHLLALDALAQLESLDLSDEVAIKKYHFSLSDIIRNYFEAISNINVTDMTFDEIKGSISNYDGLAIDQRKKLLNILFNTDIIKFTDQLADSEHSEQEYKNVKQFIVETMPNQDDDQESVI